MPTTIPTGFAAILAAVEAQLIAVTGLPDERITASTEDGSSAHFQGDQDIIMRVLPLTPVGEDIDSKGRLMTRVSRPLEVTPRTSLATDSAGGTDTWLSDPTYGHLQLEEAIFNALHQFIPTDGGGNWLVTEPMRLAPSGEPRRPEPEGLQPAVWGDSRLVFEITYILPVTNPSIL